MSSVDDLRPYDPDPLQVGDRVRVRLSGECGVQYYPPSETLPELWAEHDQAADGLIGTVERIYAEEEHGHFYEVRTDSSWWHSCGSWGHAINGDNFSRLELERQP